MATNLEVVLYGCYMEPEEHIFNKIFFKILWSLDQVIQMKKIRFLGLNDHTPHLFILMEIQ